MKDWRMAVAGLALGAVLALGGCATDWRPSWGRPAPPPAGSDTDRLLAQAQAAADRAEDRQGLLDALALYERTVATDPACYPALCEQANLSILLATAYTEPRAEKAALFHKAMACCERAMYTNPEFQARIDGGAKPWEAASVLTDREMDAMFFWVTAVFYDFKEAMTLPERIGNMIWLQWAGKVLERMEQLDPGWHGGAVAFTWALYYNIQPQGLGGDRAKSAAYLQNAVTDNPNWLLSRWGRATHFRLLTNDREGFRQDLEWVLAQDIARPGESHPWKAYFQRNARELLGNAEK